MHRRTAGFLLAALSVIAACAQTAVTQPETADVTPAGSCESFPGALRVCAESKCETPHPFAARFPIEHRVVGESGGACQYTQSMPGDMHMRCGLSEAGRAELATMIEESSRAQSLSFSFSSSDPLPDNVMTRECEIIDADGRVLPWGTSSR